MKDPHPIKNIYWNGGGFTGMIYNISVAEHLEREKLNENTRYDFDKLRHFGVSGGAGFALLMVLGLSSHEQLDFFFNKARMYDRLDSFRESISRIVMDLILIALQDETDHSIRKKCNGRLNIGYVDENGTLEFITKFNTRDDVKRAILYTSNIPGVVLHETEFGEGIRMDGGMVSVDPITMTRYGMTTENTLVVTSPISVPWCLMGWSEELYMMWYAYNSATVRLHGIESSGFGYAPMDQFMIKHTVIPLMTSIHRMTTRSSKWNDWLDEKLRGERK
jgi:hypothetical protein